MLLLPALLYIYLLARMILAWNRLPKRQTPPTYKANTRISLLIPMRNEAYNLPGLLNSLQQLRYPTDLLDIILLDDHSTDDTLRRLTDIKPPMRYYPLPEDKKGKKAALAYGNELASGQLIVTTDADCRPHPDWLQQIAYAYEQSGRQVIGGAVVMEQAGTWLGQLQQLDIAGTMLVTGGAQQLGWFTLANGANLAYTADSFKAVNGYQKDKQASGDDLFLVQKIVAKSGQQPCFLTQSESWVHTPVEPNWATFWQQRLRWASKNQAYPQWRLTAYWGWVYLYCCALLILPFLAIAWPALWPAAITLWLGKIIGDGWLLVRAANHFRIRRSLVWLPLLLPLHTCYVVAVGSAALLGTGYLWRDRQYGNKHESTTTH